MWARKILGLEMLLLVTGESMWSSNYCFSVDTFSFSGTSHCRFCHAEGIGCSTSYDITSSWIRPPSEVHRISDYSGTRYLYWEINCLLADLFEFHNLVALSLCFFFLFMKWCLYSSFIPFKDIFFSNISWGCEQNEREKNGQQSCFAGCTLCIHSYILLNFEQLCTRLPTIFPFLYHEVLSVKKK